MEKELQHVNTLIQGTIQGAVELVSTQPPGHHLIPINQLPPHATGTTLEHISFSMPPGGMEMWPAPDGSLKNDMDDKMKKRKFYCNHCGHELEAETIESILNDNDKPRKKAKTLSNSSMHTVANTTVTTNMNDIASGTLTNNGDYISEKKKQKNHRAEQKDIITTFARIIMTESDSSYAKSPLPKDAVFALYEKHVKSHPIPYHVFWRYVLGKSDNKKQKPLWGVNVQSSRKGGSRGILGVRFRNVDDPIEKSIMDTHLVVLTQHGVTVDANAMIDDLRSQYEAHRPKLVPQYHHHHKVEPQMNQQQGELDSKSDMMEMSPPRFPYTNGTGKLLKVKVKGNDLYRRVVITKYTMKELIEKLIPKFGIADASTIREIRELPDVILMDDADVNALPNNAELELTILPSILQV